MSLLIQVVCGAYIPVAHDEAALLARRRKGLLRVSLPVEHEHARGLRADEVLSSSLKNHQRQRTLRCERCQGTHQVTDT